MLTYPAHLSILVESQHSCGFELHPTPKVLTSSRVVGNEHLKAIAVAAALLLLGDGRVLHRVSAPDIPGTISDTINALLERARSLGAVTVGNGMTLVHCRASPLHAAREVAVAPEKCTCRHRGITGEHRRRTGDP